MQRILTVRQVAELLQLSTEHVRRLARTGDMPAMKIGDGPKAHWRFFKSQIIEWIAAGRPKYDNQHVLFDRHI